MTKVFTGNVFLSTSIEAIEKVFFLKTKTSSFKDSLLSLSEEDLLRSYVVTPFKNTNLLEFDYKWSFKGNSSLTLRFLETDNLFELFFVNSSPASKIIKKIYEELEKAKDPTNERARNLEPRVTQALFTESSDINLGEFNNLYFAYGVGDDLRNWGGPRVAELTEANIITTSEGVKEVEMVFMPTKVNARYNSVEFDNAYGLNRAINRFNRIFKEKDLIRVLGVESVEDSKFLVSPDRKIRDLLKSYISGISENNNVIILTPNLNSFLQNRISTRYKNEVKTAESNFIAENSFEDRFFFGLINLQRQSPNFERDFKKLQKKQEAAKNSKLKSFFKDELKSLAINYVDSMEGQNINTAITPEISQESGIDVLDGQPKITMSYEFSYKDDDNKNYHVLLIPLYEFIEGIKSIGFKGNIDYLEESDMRVLRLWKKHGFIEDDTKPALVFGDSNIIKNLLYLDDVENYEDISTRRLAFEAAEDGAAAAGAGAAVVAAVAGAAAAGAGANFNRNVLTNPFETFPEYDSEQYQIDYFEEFLKDIVKSSFGEGLFDTDELALEDEEVAQSRIETNFPFFKYNLKNSNVLGVNVEYNNNYLAVFNTGLKTLAESPIVNSGRSLLLEGAEELIPSKVLTQVSGSIKDLDLSKNVGLDNYKKILNFLLSETETTNSDVFSNLVDKDFSESFNLQQLAAYIEVLLVENYSKSKKNAVVTIETTKNNLVDTQKAILDEMARLAFSVTIKTLPFFGLRTTLQRKCMLAAMQNSIIGFNNTKRLAPYSGRYVIDGFRHYLSADDMYSEFTLVVDGIENADMNEIINSKGVLKVTDAIRNIKRNQEAERKRLEKEKPLSLEEARRRQLKKAKEAEESQRSLEEFRRGQ